LGRPVGTREARDNDGPSQDSAPVETDTGAVETHISTLFFLGDRVYKLKKPVHTGFLDWSTPERRHQACLLEVALNSRLAPDVYLGVADIVDSEGNRCDSLVVMRRLPSSRRLSRMILDGVDVRPDLRSLARQLAAFHSGCRHGPEVMRAAAPGGASDVALAAAPVTGRAPSKRDPRKGVSF
jgi:aminoglycoside phosphotransferase family enzyme